MVAPSIIRKQRDEALSEFHEHLDALGIDSETRQRLDTAGLGSGLSTLQAPRPEDGPGNAAYSAAVFAALTKVIREQSQRIDALSERLEGKGAEPFSEQPEPEPKKRRTSKK